MWFSFKINIFFQTHFISDISLAIVPSFDDESAFIECFKPSIVYPCRPPLSIMPIPNTAQPSDLVGASTSPFHPCFPCSA